MLRYGAFVFVDLGDLSGNTLQKLVCPRNMLGEASVYLIAHHGDYDSDETAVYRVINGLARLGATVVHKETARVHVSGHAPAGELRTLLNVAKPRYLMPVHGEWRHLRAHAALAEETGMSRDRVILAEDGVVVDLVDGKASIVGSVPIGNVYVDGLNVGDVGEESLQARRIHRHYYAPMTTGMGLITFEESD